jgi:hypothetical protein
MDATRKNTVFPVTGCWSFTMRNGWPLAGSAQPAFLTHQGQKPAQRLVVALDAPGEVVPRARQAVLGRIAKHTPAGLAHCVRKPLVERGQRSPSSQCKLHIRRVVGGQAVATRQNQHNGLAEFRRIGLGLYVSRVKLGEECGGLRGRDKPLVLPAKNCICHFYIPNGWDEEFLGVQFIQRLFCQRGFSRILTRKQPSQCHRSVKHLHSRPSSIQERSSSCETPSILGIWRKRRIASAIR